MGNYPNNMTSQTYEQMRAAIDGGLSGISFSGADISAVVYLPIDQSIVDKDKKVLVVERDKLKKALTELEDQYNGYIDYREAYNEDITVLQQRQTATPPGSQEWISLENQINTLKNKLGTLERNYRENNIDQMPVAIERIRDRLKAIQNNLSFLDSQTKTSSKGQTWIKPVVLGSLQTISYSSHREKFPVRTLGRVLPKSYTRGPRTIAGSMIFTVLNKQSLWELIEYYSEYRNTGVVGSDHHWGEYEAVTVDQLPPFDVTLIFSNEYGDNSYMVLYGVELVNEGQTMSIQDLLTENVMQFVARDVDPLRPLSEFRRKLIENKKFTASEVNKRYSRRRQAGRMNPFI